MELKDDLRDRTLAEERAERNELGFQRQPEVRWLSPSLLAKSGVEVLVSATFGKFADKREIQTTPQGTDANGTFDLSDEVVGADGVWVDYLADTGDGWNATYTMAWLLARGALAPEGAPSLPRGRMLLVGGDQVYPTAGAIPYEDRFIGPFASAFPNSDPASAPYLFATPGNHDWYDGLASFLRVFCSKNGWIGGWKTRQRRSYYAIKLPNDWWIWAIDIQLDTYIDDVQLDYFRAQPLAAGDKVILLTAKPSWVKAKPGQLEPVSWKYLAFFEDRMVRDRGARLAIVLTGDLHHYARYEPQGAGADEAPTRITAGGGGAYLSATHTLPETLELQSLGRKPYPVEPSATRPKKPLTPPQLEPTYGPREPVRYARRAVYPTLADSAKLGVGIKHLRALNPEFASMLGAVYALIALAMLAALNSAPGPLELTDHLSQFVSGAFGPVTLLLVVLLFAATYSAADLKAVSPESVGKLKRRRSAVAVGHGLLHLVTITIIVLLAVVLLAYIVDLRDGWSSVVLWVIRLVVVAAAAALAFLAGKFIGTWIWAYFMSAIHRTRGWKAPNNANEVFTGQSIADYKNFLRMRFHRDGGLTIYPLGVDKICTTWDYQPAPAASTSRFEPRGDDGPTVALIDVPLVYGADGAPVVPAAAPAPPDG